NCVSTGNGAGIVTGSDPGSFGEEVVLVSNTTVTNNVQGVIAVGGAILSRGDNTVEGNQLDDGEFTGVFAAK
ncbi:MAG: hypothetical protein ACRD3M_02555, partial [Thermoanaerobaculia bacterium]